MATVAKKSVFVAGFMCTLYTPSSTTASRMLSRTFEFFIEAKTKKEAVSIARKAVVDACNRHNDAWCKDLSYTKVWTDDRISPEAFTSKAKSSSICKCEETNIDTEIARTKKQNNDIGYDVYEYIKVESDGSYTIS